MRIRRFLAPVLLLTACGSSSGSGSESAESSASALETTMVIATPQLTLEHSTDGDPQPLCYWGAPSNWGSPTRISFSYAFDAPSHTLTVSGVRFAPAPTYEGDSVSTSFPGPFRLDTAGGSSLTVPIQQAEGGQPGASLTLATATSAGTVSVEVELSISGTGKYGTDPCALYTLTVDGIAAVDAPAAPTCQSGTTPCGVSCALAGLRGRHHGLRHGVRGYDGRPR
jgi:hypothetical protein